MVERARAAVWSAPDRAERWINRALELSPSGREALELRGLCALSRGDAPAALTEFRALLSDGAGLRQASRPMVLAAARAALLAEDPALALALYRQIALSIDRLADDRERARVLVEAAVAASLVSPPRFREAGAYLADARAHLSPLLAPVLDATWEPVLEREGDARHAPWPTERADSLRWVLERTAPSRGAPGEWMPVLPPGQRDALIAAVTVHDEQEGRAR